jgi:hypothetical protein
MTVPPPSISRLVIPIAQLFHQADRSMRPRSIAAVITRAPAYLPTPFGDLPVHPGPQTTHVGAPEAWCSSLAVSGVDRVGVQDDACRVRSVSPQARGQAGVVFFNGFHAHHDAVDRMADPMDELAGGWAGDPAGIPGARGNSPVERGRALDNDEGLAGGDPSDKRFV